MRWEKVCVKNSDITERLKVPGGWWVCRTDGSLSPKTMTSIFIEDPFWVWDLKEDMSA